MKSTFSRENLQSNGKEYKKRKFVEILHKSSEELRNSVVAEIKKASPSKGIIRGDFDPVWTAKQYEKGGAACLSILTEPDFFLGSLDYLLEVRKVCHLPILRKDFIIDEIQIKEQFKPTGKPVLKGQISSMYGYRNKVFGGKGLFGKKKEPFWAVDSLDFKVAKGSVVSILGPNGCGKTTTLRMIAGMLTPSKGTAFIDSVDVRKDKQTVKSKIGYMTNNTSLYDRLNVIETVKFFAELNQISPDVYMPRAEKLFDQLDMRKYLNKRIADLSTGMKQKTSIVRTLIHDPDLIVLDEPTTGVDVTGQSVIVDLIKSIKDSGKTLIFSTHQLNEVRDIADHIIVMKAGEKIFDGNNNQFQELDRNKNFTEIFMELVNE